MKKTLYNLFFKLFFCALVLISCTEVEADLTSSIDNNIADAAFNHINSVIDTEVGYFEGEFDINEINSFLIEQHDTCPSISLSFSSDLSYIDSIWIDYGEEGVEWMERTKTGKILITQNGKRNQVGTLTKAELINFTIDDYTITGTQTIERTEVEVNSGNWIGTDHVQVIDAKINNPNRDYEFSWNSDRVRQGNIVNGELVVCIEGNMNGINSKGVEYTITTKTPLKFKLSCPRFVSGVLNVYDESATNYQTIDYGDGTCDLSANVTIEYNDYEISLW